jgi:CHAT domain-containing protein
VLDALAPEAGALPRIWWLPLGLLGLFPLHAAGHAGKPGALDLAVSSYTSTLRALAHARGRPTTTVRRQLVVVLARTPGLPDLPGTVAEAVGLHTDTPPLLDSGATTDNVLAALSEHTWAHFACHASTDVAAPSRSGLCLHDGRLSLPQLGRLRLTDAELAYLSACSTADRGIRHADESLHMASAFQLAGFRHVIASLWPLDDHVAAIAAQEFYRRLPDTTTAAHAATALREVTRHLRDQYPDRPELWASLVHTGP